MNRRKGTKFSTRHLLGFLGIAAAGLIGCDEPQTTLPASLQAPVTMEVVDGEVCLPLVDATDGTIATTPLEPCDEEGRGFGLVVNARSNKVGVAALGQSRPRIVNLDSREPGVSQIRVGESPIDITVAADKTAAVVANQGDRSLMGIDLWTLRALPEVVEVEGTLRTVESLEDRDGEARIAVLMSGPDRLDIRAGVRCERPSDTVDRRDHDPTENCAWSDVETESLALPARPVDMDVDAAAGRAWVIYRNLNALSWIALDEEALGEEESCLDEEMAPPCEVERLAWDESDEDEQQSLQFGATQVEHDPLGLFVYVLDRPNNQLLVFDRQRRQLINASLSAEPSRAPFSTSPGISLSRSATAMSADVTRELVEEGDGIRLMNYRIGARVAADNGQLYRVGVVDIDCVVQDPEEPLFSQDFIFDSALRAESAESSCVFTPAFPLGGDPDFEGDEELLERRVVEQDNALVAVTPIFSLRDGEGRQGRLVGRAQCTQPEELIDAMREVTSDSGSLGCGSPLIPQPLGLDVDEDSSSFSDAPRADLMTFARTFLELGESDDLGAVERVIERQVYDFRLVNESWSVSYEGALPGIGTAERGLVARDEESRFLSGGVDYCAAAVEVGDRLRILSEPVDASGCEVFEGEPEFRTYEIVEVGAFDVELAVIDGDETADELPTRSCFDRGLRYEIRPSDQWVVAGEQSGMSSPWQREGESCVLREGAESGRLGGRVETGEEYVGPYLRFRIYEGEVDAVEGLEYRFQVERNFSLSGELIVPGRREGTQSTLPRQVLFTPDLGFGRLVTVVDSGADRIFVRNRATGESRFVR